MNRVCRALKLVAGDPGLVGLEKNARRVVRRDLGESIAQFDGAGVADRCASAIDHGRLQHLRGGPAAGG